MKNVLTLLVFFIFISSCSQLKKENARVDDKQLFSSVKGKERTKFPQQICPLISRTMVNNYFQVAEEELELIENSWSAYGNYLDCGFKWKKPNFEELQDKQYQALKTYRHKGRWAGDKRVDTEFSSVPELGLLESPYSEVLIGHFREFSTEKQAQNEFSMIYPTTEEEKTSSIKIDGVGNQAYYDKENKFLDVRFGTLAFKIFIDSELDMDSTIQVSVKMAEEVYQSINELSHS